MVASGVESEEMRHCIEVTNSAAYCLIVPRIIRTDRPNPAPCDGERELGTAVHRLVS